jgi:phosphopantothenoylcysteine decarboxylase
MKVLLGVTGSVAAKLTTKTVKAFQSAGHEVNVVITEAAKHFISYDFDCPIWKDVDEFPIRYDRVNDDGSMMIPHIYLKDWADVLVVAPLTANTLAKIANGIADNLLTCTIRAWQPNKPIVVAPAMNTDMWYHPATYSNVESIQKMYNYRDTRPRQFLVSRIPQTIDTIAATLFSEDVYMMSTAKRKFVLVYPIEKKLACGATGIGAMANINDIVTVTNFMLKKS